MADVLQQTITPPVRRGEAASVVISGTFATTPAAWTTELRMKLYPQDEWLVFNDISVSVTGSYDAAWTVALSSSDSESLTAGTNTFEFWRTDSGYEECISAGTWLVLEG